MKKLVLIVLILILLLGVVFYAVRYNSVRRVLDSMDADTDNIFFTSSEDNKAKFPFKVTILKTSSDYVVTESPTTYKGLTFANICDVEIGINTQGLTKEDKVNRSMPGMEKLLSDPQAQISSCRIENIKVKSAPKIGEVSFLKTAERATVIFPKQRSGEDSLADTTLITFPRYQFEKIVEDHKIDSSFDAEVLDIADDSQAGRFSKLGGTLRITYLNDNIVKMSKRRIQRTDQDTMVNYDEILKDAGINTDDLKARISFDILLTTVKGEKFSKRFEVDIQSGQLWIPSEDDIISIFEPRYDVIK